MQNVKITKSDKNETIFTIQEDITVTLIAENFNKTGEMIVEYNEEKISEEDVTNIVNTYFETLLESLENRKNNSTKKQDII